MDAISRLIFITSPANHAEHRPLPSMVAKALCANDAAVLLIRLEGTTKPDGWAKPDLWVPRFQKLGAITLRGALSGSTSYATISLNLWPEPELTRAMLRLLRSSFEWIVVSAPFGIQTSETVALEAADLLLWMVDPTRDAEQAVRDAQQALGARHFPEEIGRAHV